MSRHVKTKYVQEEIANICEKNLYTVVRIFFLQVVHSWSLRCVRHLLNSAYFPESSQYIRLLKYTLTPLSCLLIWLEPKQDVPSLIKLTWQWKITMFNKRSTFKSLFFHCHVSFRGCTFLLILPLWIFSCRCAFESLVPARADCSHTRWSPCWEAQRSRPTGLMGWHDRCLLGFIVVPLPETNIFAPEKWMVGILSPFPFRAFSPIFTGDVCFREGTGMMLCDC